jgi:hypothetical protein
MLLRKTFRAHLKNTRHLSFMRVPNIVVVNPPLPTKTLPELVAYAKANPGRINFGSGGAGGSGHMATELFKMMAGVEMTHVPYRGLAPALTDLLGDQVQVIFSSYPAAIEYVRAGRLRALAVTTAARFPRAGYPRGRRVCPRLRSKPVVRRLCAPEHVTRHCRHPEQGDQRRPERSENAGAAA